MLSKNKKLIICVSLITVAILVLILGTIFDLQISKALTSLSQGKYYSQNTFAMIGECFGEIFLSFIVAFCSTIIFFYLKLKPIKNKFLYYTLSVFLLLYAVGILFYFTKKTFSYIGEYSGESLGQFNSSILGILTFGLISIIMELLIVLLTNKLGKDFVLSAYLWAIFVLITTLLSVATIKLLKNIVDRTRYRAMVYVGDENFYSYSNWFNIKGNTFKSLSKYADDFFNSFPSGHTCVATNIFVICFLPLFYKKADNKKFKIISITIAIIYTFLIALSRIIAGAHFFTDVYVSFLITIGCIFLTVLIINKVMKRKRKK